MNQIKIGDLVRPIAGPERSRIFKVTGILGSRIYTNSKYSYHESHVEVVFTC